MIIIGRCSGTENSKFAEVGLATGYQNHLSSLGCSITIMATSLDLINQAPKGTKLWLLHVGNLECDEAWFKRGGGTSTLSNPNPARERRKLIMVSVLIEHPVDGLILFETGSGKDYPEIWGAPINDIFARVDYSEDQELDVQIKKTGHDIKDVKMVVIGHLHLDHAGGLEYFRNTSVPIYVHEKELKHAFYSVATKSDLGVYLPHYLTFDLSWVPFSGSFVEIAQGLNLHHAPGHTPGLCILQVNMPKTGPWVFTTDMYHVSENYEESVPQGWLAREHDDWVRSNQMIHMLQRRTGARMIFGHCTKALEGLKMAPHAYE